MQNNLKAHNDQAEALREIMQGKNKQQNTEPSPFQTQRGVMEDQAEPLRQLMQKKNLLSENQVKPSVAHFLTKIIEQTQEAIQLNTDYIFIITHDKLDKNHTRYQFYFSTNTMLYPFEPEPTIGFMLIQNNENILKKHDLELTLRFTDPGPGQDFIIEEVTAKPIIPKK